MGEQGLITDERLMITDFVHTENAEGNGGPQADEVGEQQLSSIGQQLKENYFFNCRSRKRDGGLWSAIAINDQQLKEKKCISTDDTDGGPQADCFGEPQIRNHPQKMI